MNRVTKYGKYLLAVVCLIGAVLNIIRLEDAESVAGVAKYTVLLVLTGTGSAFWFVSARDQDE